MPKSARFTVTAEMVSAITTSHVLDEELENIAQRAGEVLELSECDLYGWVAHEEQVTCLAVWAREPHPGDADWVGAKLSLAEQPTFRRVVREGRILAAYLDDPGLPQADRVRMEAWGERSCLLVPLIFQEKVIGCLQLIERRRQHLFSARDRDLAATLAALAAVAIQNARLHGQLEALAITDGVTGLYNHRHFHERLAAEVIRAQRYGLPLSLLMIDIDGFKGYNDRYGHPAGDALLRALGVLLRSHTRAQIDVVARYGGDEFAMALPSTGARGASSVGQRLQDAVAQRRFVDGTQLATTSAAAESPAGAQSGDSYAVAAAERIRTEVEAEAFGSESPPPVITVSIGVASLAEHGDSLGGLIETADKALYRAKQLGKNRVELADVRPA